MKHFFQISLKPLNNQGGGYMQKGYEASDDGDQRPEVIAIEKALASIPAADRKNYVIGGLQHMGTIDG